MLSCTCSDQARPGRSDLELELLEIRARHTTLHVEHFDADDFPGRIEVEDDSRLDLFRLDDIGFIEAQVERVDLLVVVHSHGLPLSRRSSFNAPSAARFGLPRGRCRLRARRSTA